MFRDMFFNLIIHRSFCLLVIDSEEEVAEPALEELLRFDEDDLPREEEDLPLFDGIYVKEEILTIIFIIINLNLYKD